MGSTVHMSYWKTRCSRNEGYGLNCVPPNSFVEVLIAITAECDFIWRPDI